MPVLTIEVRTVFGRKILVPACEASRLLLKLTSTTRGKRRVGFRPEHLRTIERLGYSVTYVAPTKPTEEEAP